MHIFQAIVAAQVLYGLSSSWLTTAQVQRLNGFQARCLRRILRIPSSFVSRISNKSVVERAKTKSFSSQLLKQQLLLLGRVAHAPAHDVLRRLTFVGESLQPMTHRFVRKVGRPRQEWAPKMLKEGLEMVGSMSDLQEVLKEEMVWHSAVNKYRGSLGS